MKTLVLLSGGLDSATVLGMEYHNAMHPHESNILNEISTIAFDYGQLHKIELTRARLIAEHYKVPFEMVGLPTMPRINDVVFAGRNLVFASVAIAHAQAHGIDRIAVGCNASDYERFPDCRGTFWKSLRECAQTYGVRIATPLLEKSKRDVARIARSLAVPVDITWSCYSPRRQLKGGWDSGGARDPDNHGFEDVPCGKCLACKTRNEALAA